MPLEIYVYTPSGDPSIPEDKKWKLGTTIYPGEEVQIPSVTNNGRYKLIRVQVKPDDSMSTVHVVYPTEVIIRSKLSETPSQVEFDDNESENLPILIRRGESYEVFSRWIIKRETGKVVEEIARGKLSHR